VPGAIVATVNDAGAGVCDIVPAFVIKLQNESVTMLPEIVQVLPESAGAKPLPVIVTLIPAGPELGSSEIVGWETTVKGVDAESPVLPAT
jgi:hypothetical protein